MSDAFSFQANPFLAPHPARPAFLSHAMRTPLYSTPEDGEGGGLDLDLGEMFEMFDAADKEEDFDEAVKKVKGEKAEEK